jgi:hypothetical protein
MVEIHKRKKKIDVEDLDAPIPLPNVTAKILGKVN